MNPVRTILVTLWLLLLNGCASFNTQPPTPTDAANSAYSGVPIFYATHRHIHPITDLNARFGQRRQALSLGYSLISLPESFPAGEQSSYLDWIRTKHRKPDEELALLDAWPLHEHDFWHNLRAIETQSHEPVLLFVHGYNTTFERALRISTKLTHDIHHSGPTLLYSWPSQEKIARYSADENSIEWVMPELATFIDDLLTNTKRPVLVLAHSLGSRLVANALVDLLAKQPAHADAIRALVLAAPDIDSAIFKRDLAPVFQQHQIPVTVYASENDIAMKFAFNLFTYPRLGQSGEFITLADGVDTIDASESQAKSIGHEYFSQGNETIADLYYALTLNWPAAQRPTLQTEHVQQNKNVKYFWRLLANPPR